MMKALNLRLQIFTEKPNQEVTLTYNQLGGIYDGKGNFELAKNYFIMAIENQLKVVGDPAHPSLMQYLENIQLMDTKMNQETN